MTAVYLAAFIVGGLAVVSALVLGELHVGGGISPLTVAKIVEALKASGIDVAAMLTRDGTAPPTEVIATNSEPAPTTD